MVYRWGILYRVFGFEVNTPLLLRVPIAASYTIKGSQMFQRVFDFTGEPNALAELGAATERKGRFYEGDGVFTLDSRVTAHFLMRDGPALKQVIFPVGSRVVALQQR